MSTKRPPPSPHDEGRCFKGAPAVVLKLVQRMPPVRTKSCRWMLTRVCASRPPIDMADRAAVLALAVRHFDKEGSQLSDDSEGGYTFLGLE